MAAKKKSKGMILLLGFIAALGAATVSSLIMFSIFIGLAFVIIIIVVLFFLFVITIINSSAFVTPYSPSSLLFFDFGTGFIDPTSCPIPGGYISLGSYDPRSENERAGGHGSSYYWNVVYYGDCYSIPQYSGCRASAPVADSNRCNYPGVVPACEWYGFAADVFSSASQPIPIVLPTINNLSVNWNCWDGFSNGSVGHTINCATIDSNPSVRLVLTHVVKPAVFPTNVPSGTVVTVLFDQGGNTHLHLEAQINGGWVRPELNFCQ